MSMSTRRDFLKRALRSAPLISLVPTAPEFLARTARAAVTRADARALVVVQLDGGNDGINTVVPYKDEGYARHRSVLRLSPSGLLKIADGVGFHPSLAGFARLLESGRLAVVPGVGYPNPNRSHFESMAIWHSARTDASTRRNAGWLGLGLDEGQPPAGGGPSAFSVGAGPMPAAIRGRRSFASGLERANDLTLAPGIVPSAADPAAVGDPDDGLTAFVRRASLNAYATAGRLSEVARDRDPKARYPETGLARRLELVSRLLKAGLGTRVFYTAQPGYDTHAAQLPAHAARLSELSGALEAFLDDLAASGLAERILVLCFSEFGRRVAENGSAGTDHGTAGPVFLAGPGVRPGLLGPEPSLTDLEEGDLKMTVDFRRVYASVLDGWLGIPSAGPLGGVFEPLPVL
jgi:uncharacterized protein (DUF1501 family)